MNPAPTAAADNPFPRWLEEQRLSVRAAADALGASTSGVMAWKRTKPPLYVLLACAAWAEQRAPIR